MHLWNGCSVEFERGDVKFDRNNVSPYTVFMNTTAISIKTEPKVKKEAKRLADELGVSLSALMNSWLKQFVKTKTVTFDATEEEPNEHLDKLMLHSKKNYKAIKGSPLFTSDEELIKKDPKKYRHIDTMQQWFDEQGI